MTIAKGQAVRQAERNIVLQGFNEQLEVVEQSQYFQEESLKSKLYDIITDYTISDEEKKSLQLPLLNTLEEVEEKHIRIRRAIFVGLYSFWEMSLMDIYRHIAYYTLPEQEKSADKKKQNHKKGVQDYLTNIYGNNMSETVKSFSHNIKELRNYMVHGSMTEDRCNTIKSLMESNPEFHIKENFGNFYFEDYNGLRQILSIFEQELDKADKTINKNIQ